MSMLSEYQSVKQSLIHGLHGRDRYLEKSRFNVNDYSFYAPLIRQVQKKINLYTKRIH
ncbi:hypothetical protein Fifi44_00011 [Erwinia phage Fifi44]|uniref:Uncharacterized protein n=1 Tax=Erwinia phage Fifi44 TaxID=2876597 RepID=A0AAE9C0F2_9CAUD|nr:hypothetical protein QNG95_gp11 [Erwinia phage Fifi44]UCR74880.1 hypothetical protein Fifi44_00011 [Erwinia phage Fifi44]UCR80886.1 hypothetical protein Fifi451_00066 [Erwinia phage Fifi451]